jgi:hypothetical protein
MTLGRSRLIRDKAVPHSVAYSTRVPAVYLAHAFLAIVAILAVRGMNNLRVPNGPHGSIPTAPTNKFRESKGLPLSVDVPVFLKFAL